MTAFGQTHFTAVARLGNVFMPSFGDAAGSCPAASV